VARNKVYGTIKGHQEKQFPGRAIATDLASPDFAEWARAFGLTGYRITADDGVDAVIGEALATPGAAVIHVDQRGDRISAYA
jgi:acetolactate synthase-1/2/3 large subunit